MVYLAGSVAAGGAGPALWPGVQANGLRSWFDARTSLSIGADAAWGAQSGAAEDWLDQITATDRGASPGGAECTAAPIAPAGLVGVTAFDLGTPLERPLPDVLTRSAPVRDGARAVRAHVARSTALVDGGIAGQSPGVGGHNAPDRVRSIVADGSDFDITDVTLRWDAASRGPVTLSVESGVKAIHAVVSSERAETIGTVQTTTIDHARGIVSVPVVGGALAWKLTDAMTVSGSASTQVLPSSAPYFDFIAETGIRLRPNIGLYAGYQYVWSEFAVEDLPAEVNAEGVYARVRIRF